MYGFLSIFSQSTDAKFKRTSWLNNIYVITWLNLIYWAIKTQKRSPNVSDWFVFISLALPVVSASSSCLWIHECKHLHCTAISERSTVQQDEHAV